MPVELVRITGSTPVDHHVNPSAIVAVQPLTTGDGHVWLTNGDELFVTAAALQVLAALLVAPAAAASLNERRVAVTVTDRALPTDRPPATRRAGRRMRGDRGCRRDCPGGAWPWARRYAPIADRVVAAR